MGLTIGIACASMAYVFIQHEKTYDQFHKASETIFRVSAAFHQQIFLSTTPGILAPSLKENFPEVVSFLRLMDKDCFVQTGQEIFKEKVLLVEPNFFSFFDFPLQKGDVKNCLSAHQAIVLSESMAQKYFGPTNPIGASLSIFLDDEKTTFQVTGVAADAASNSSIQFDFLMPIEQGFKNDLAALNTEWKDFPVTSFIRLRSAEDKDHLAEQLPFFIKRQFETVEESDGSEFVFQLHAFKDYHLGGSSAVRGLSQPGEARYVSILSIIAILILIVACINFMNLSNAQGSKRLKEIGVRQVMGAQRPQLIGQLLTESILISMLALVLAIAIIETLLPWSKHFFGQVLSFNWTDVKVLLPLITISLLTGIFAGIYPSLLLSKLRTVDTFQSNFKIGGNNWITKGSLTFQFALSIGLLACTFIMYQQQQFIGSQNLGFNKEEVVVVPLQLPFSKSQQTDTRQLVRQYRENILQHPGITKAAGVSSTFSKGNRMRFIEMEQDAQVGIIEYAIDEHYLDLLDIELTSGRNFSSEFQDDVKGSVIVNDAFLKTFNVNETAGFTLPESFSDLSGSHIVGTTIDYHNLSLKTNIKPMMLHMLPNIDFQYVLVKIKPDEVQASLAHLKHIWQQFRPDKPFEFSFLDEDIQAQYQTETRWSTVLSGSAALAIFIALLGLFGLVALVLAERTKEIGIRKILGASTYRIAGTFSKEFIILVAIGFMLASPVAYYLMQQWLTDFSYHIELHWLVFVIAGLTVVVLAVLTTSFQSIKAAMANPVEALRNE